MSACWNVTASNWMLPVGIATATNIPELSSSLLFFLRGDSRRGSSSWLEFLLPRVVTILTVTWSLKPDTD